MTRKRDTRKAIITGVSAIAAVADVASGGLGIITGATQASLLVFDALWERQQARGGRMLRAAFDVSDSEFGTVVRTKLQDEAVRDALLEAMRTALESLSDAVIPALGGLIREYDKHKRPPDGFFRACCRFLQDLSGEEFGSFSALLRRIVSAGLDERFSASIRAVTGRESWAKPAEGAPESGPFILITTTGYDADSRRIATTDCAPEHISRLFHLLEREGLARTRTEGRDQAVASLTIEVATAARIAKTLA